MLQLDSEIVLANLLECIPQSLDLQTLDVADNVSQKHALYCRQTRQTSDNPCLRGNPGLSDEFWVQTKVKCLRFEHMSILTTFLSLHISQHNMHLPRLCELQGSFPPRPCCFSLCRSDKLETRSDLNISASHVKSGDFWRFTTAESTSESTE
jgi:hypothetical protein